ncbi:MAG: hypothetical protein GY795_48765 [Desulfobacterales bacterium]|nr:hypothetical protein [Desulfobacterales bacterium]
MKFWQSTGSVLKRSHVINNGPGRSAKDKRSDLLQNGTMQKEKNERSLAACLPHSL